MEKVCDYEVWRGGVVTLAFLHLVKTQLSQSHFMLSVILCLLTLAQSDRRSSLHCLGFVVHVVLGSLRSAMLKYKVCDMSEHVYG